MSHIYIIRNVVVILTFLLLVDSFVKRLSLSKFSKREFNRKLVVANAAEETIINDNDKSVQLKVLTFNILAPCYSTGKFSKESEISQKNIYLGRNNEICDRLIDSNADIICLQEFWSKSEDLRTLYQSRLGGIYNMRELRRTSHWCNREDGLAIFFNKERFILQDAKDILFHDCGDRVAQLLLLAIKPSSVDTNVTLPNQQFLCVNTHLLFPHNKASTNIRIREMSKILDFVESYRQRELCTGFYCNRSDVSFY